MYFALISITTLKFVLFSVLCVFSFHFNAKTSNRSVRNVYTHTIPTVFYAILEFLRARKVFKNYFN